ncbi:hypothetical protein QE424_002463 [Stenotrophomonas rhizophila]|uniref:Uncharacterized protein n=1 Tax=Stenotrophomonas rhizophila TaxID=216778 RepID=A0AAP5AIF5_9GAMM|nr:hypothetical protein [Stenotrophomonas rhizophila]MDQ1109304.1 hypothetical protein [Stenotrophomonas rhizophila]UQY88822.1 hypothetical protein LQE85_06290 [Stenotrophomonas rhizophila]
MKATVWPTLRSLHAGGSCWLPKPPLGVHPGWPVQEVQGVEAKTDDEGHFKRYGLLLLPTRSEAQASRHTAKNVPPLVQF